MVYINRGFLARATLQQDLADFSAPVGEIEVTGILLPSVDGGRFAAVGASERAEASRPDIGLFAAEVDTAVVTEVFVQLASPDHEGLSELDPPDRGEGPHFSYAMQWFIFTTIGLIGYPLVLRRVAGGGKRRVGVAPPLDESA